MNLLKEHLAATTLATYTTNQGIIRLTRDASFWLEENEPTLDRLAVFVHEYAHFLHNFSTMAGVYSFVAALRYLRLFMNTVDETGRSHGSTVLTPEAQNELRELSKWRLHLAGASRAPFSIGSLSMSDLALASTHTEVDQIRFSSQTFSVTRGVARLSLKSNPTTVGDVSIGTYLLFEGLAWEFERILFQSAGQGTTTVDQGFPTWPYKITRLIFESVTDERPTAEQMAEVELMCLLHTDPGAAFLMYAEIFKKERNQSNFDSTLTHIRSLALEELRKIKDGVLSSLNQDLQVFLPRPTIYRGLRTMMQWAAEYLERRLAEPFFELEALRTIDRTALVNLLERFPPCPILQEKGPLVEDMELFIIAKEQPDAQWTNDIGVTQSLLHFASAHSIPSGITSSVQAREDLCRFFGACKFSALQPSPTICRRRPWESYRPDSKQACWYAAAVHLSRSLPTTSSKS